MALYPYSIAGWSFHAMKEAGTMDIFGYLEIIKSRYHVDNADIWTGFLPNADEDFIKKIRSEMDRRELGLSNLCVDYGNPWMETADEREFNRQKMLNYIKAAKILGAKTIRVDFGGNTGETMSDEAFEYIVARYKEYCAICYDIGIKIGPENHIGFDRDIGNLLKVWKAVDHPAYGHLLHLGNSSNFMEDMKLLMPIVMHTHVAANSLPFAKEVIRRLAANGYPGTISVEHHSANLELERVEWQLASVREICAELEQEGLEGPAKLDYLSNIYAGGK